MRVEKVIVIEDSQWLLKGVRVKESQEQDEVWLLEQAGERVSDDRIALTKQMVLEIWTTICNWKTEE
jgi:hypothetical protein